jgi:transcriptional regulator with GAF, ATPase, and Fis domain
LYERLQKLIFAGSPLSEVLANIAQLVESQAEGMSCTIWLHDEDGKELYCAAAPSLPGFSAHVGTMSVGPKGGSCGTAVYRRESVYVTDILTDPAWDLYRDRLLPYGIRSVWSRPLFTCEGKAFGTFSINYREQRNPGANELQLIENASHITGIAIERHMKEQALQRERDRLRLLLEITNSVTSRLDLRQVVEALSTNLFRAMQCDVSALLLPDPESGELRVTTLYNPAARGPFREGSLVPMNGSISGHVLRKAKSVRIDSFEKVREDPEFYGNPDGQLLYERVTVVAPTDSSVLILGETGTGKELVARAVHKLGSRSEKGFVKLNCAAIPLGLLESELFGHEKGAFTGAIAQKTGRFELADKGTLFLDEVGDIPLELQAKLLRVLQEQEFERLGSNRTHKVDVRLIAATHRDLPAMVKQGTFREDLYYRLKVFPIQVPALRQRTEDIPRLVRHFTALYAQRMNKRIDVIPPETMEALVRYPWPGNIRELQNFIERAVILSPQSTLRAPTSELEPFQHHKGSNVPLNDLAEVERDHILRALEASNWVISGAAARLRMKRTSLVYRMKKLDIHRPAEVPQKRSVAGAAGND